MDRSTYKLLQTPHLLAIFWLSVLCCTIVQAAKPPAPLTIKSAVYNKKAAKLTVKTVVKNTSGLLTLLHNKGGVLGQTRDNKHNFSIPLAQLGDIPCQVEVRLGDLKVNRAVKGAAADCKKAPICNVLSPIENSNVAYNQNTPFEAQVILKDKKAVPISYEWDFAGGVMGHPSGQLPGTGNVKADATFVRNNSRYRVRFTATDAVGRRCESSVNVVVGTLPAGLPNIAPLAEAAQQSAPTKANALQKAAGERVVLPYQDWTMQTASDARTVPDVYVVYGPQVNNINATVYEKARKPVVLGSDKIELKYSATSNPADPIGANSINSTSQNWPVGTPLMQATLQKSDFFEAYVPPASASLDEDSQSYSFSDFLYLYRFIAGTEDTANNTGTAAPLSSQGYLIPELASESVADEGYHSTKLNPPTNPDHGRYMPGIAAPYATNDPQPFSNYDHNDSAFAAQMLPLTDIDDTGRINPYPLFRIEARDADVNFPVSTTDIVANSGRDLHCRECHAKGKIGASSNARLYNDGHQHGGISRSFYEPKSDSIYDQEYAAIGNIVHIHPAYGIKGAEDKGNEKTDANGALVVGRNGPATCNNTGCHSSAIMRTPYKQGLHTPSTSSPLSTDMHRDHGQMQYNANKDDILRDSHGKRVRLDPAKIWDSKTGSIPNSLFPVKDPNGKILPMEENCLKCHGGMREQCYRDRMYTAGVTCYQCHGDMLAVGNSFKKSTPSADDNSYREPWLDEPDCASCHTGNANRGKTGTDGFFSGGVMRTAFDESDPSATSRPADPFNPDQIRFAIPVAAMDIGDAERSDSGKFIPFTTKTRLFRAGKDNHGQVACAACHGAAHSIWPNRDPNANDNVTAFQLQGHSGPITECFVCHTADSFAKFEDLDEGVKAIDAKIGILGGPHNMHPVDDPNWWKQAVGDIVDSTPNQPKRKGIIKGGWHNDYAKIAGRAGEDQCSACHGNDHLGTRLSKTPVDREFVNEKGKKIKVKAGTQIGCQLCHSIIKSCSASPSGSNCGKPSDLVAGTTNLAPVITSTAATQVVVGEEYRYEMKANDPEGSGLSYQLARNYSSLIDTHYMDTLTGVLNIPADKIATLTKGYDSTNQLFLFDYQVIVRDSKGAQTVQSVKVSLECPTELIWDVITSTCTKITIISRPTVDGLDAGQVYNYKVEAKQRSGEPLSYGLTGQPEGMTIDTNTGLLTWYETNNLLDANNINFTVIVSNSQGDSVTQPISLAVCGAPLHWDETAKTCLGPVNFTSDPSMIKGITVGETYTYQSNATQAGNLPLSYSLTSSPEGMSIDSKTGLINWVAQASESNQINFIVNASDSTYTAQQFVSLNVCVPPALWVASTEACINSIEFTSSPVGGIDAGQLYKYQVSTTHAKGLPITYSLGDYPSTPDQAYPTKPNGMTIDYSQTGLISWTAESQLANSGYAYFAVIATDSTGLSARQTLQVFVCESGTNWSETLSTCRGDVRITSVQPVQGLDVGQTFSYQVTATDEKPSSLPITYSLSSLYPESINMSIDANTGLINWVATATEDPNNPSVSIQFVVTATDTLGQAESQGGSLTVCVPPQHWNAENQGCL